MSSFFLLFLNKKMAEAIDRALYARVKAEAKRRFKKWPSAYGSGWLVREYKRRGGRYSGSKRGHGVDDWFRERWVDACHWPKRVPCGRQQRGRKFPYCRPSVQVSRKTPKLVQEMSQSEIEKLCKRKRKNPKRRMRSQSRKSRRRSTSRKKKCIHIMKSPRRTKKFRAVLHKCKVDFGGAGYSDFTLHKDKERKKRYIVRHRKRENWSKSGQCTAGFWSKHLLWNKPSLSSSKRSIEKRFGLNVCGV